MMVKGPFQMNFSILAFFIKIQNSAMWGKKSQENKPWDKLNHTEHVTSLSHLLNNSKITFCLGDLLVVPSHVLLLPLTSHANGYLTQSSLSKQSESGIKVSEINFCQPVCRTPHSSAARTTNYHFV